MTSICSKPNMFLGSFKYETGGLRLALLAFAFSLLCYSPWEEDGVTAVKVPASVPASHPFPCPGAQGTNRSASGFVLSLFSSKENWETQREKKGICMAPLSKEVGTALITSLSPLWEFHTRLQGPFFYYCCSCFDSLNCFPAGLPLRGGPAPVLLCSLCVL